eukprot:scaffold17121_cov60-Attheya_sp.AAC.6
MKGTTGTLGQEHGLGYVSDADVCNIDRRTKEASAEAANFHIKYLFQSFETATVHGTQHDPHSRVCRL